jgi:hypothetical protein
MASEPIDFGPDAFQRLLEAERGIPVTAPTTVAFIGRAERGPVDESVKVASFDDFRRVFGGHCAFSFVSFAVQQFFAQGGQAAVVVRVANRATRARLDLPAGGAVLRLQARVPGSREFLRASVDYDGFEADPLRFNLVVQRMSRPVSQMVVDQEFFSGLSMLRADEHFVADALADSELVRLAGPLPHLRPDATRAPSPGAPIPYVAAHVLGTDGDELTDYDVVGSNKSGTGLFALDRCGHFDLLCIPAPPGRDVGMTTFVAATRYCERRRALLIWDPPRAWSSVDAALLAARGAGLGSHNAITYFPRVRSRVEPGRYPGGMPACGAVAGLIARCDEQGIWHGLPSDDGGIRGQLVPLVDVDDRRAALLHRAGVNTIARFGSGSMLEGNVTFAGAGSVADIWQQLDRKRLAAFILGSIERHTRWVLRRRNLEDAAATLDRQVWTFLSRLRQRGALVGATPEQAFLVRVRVSADDAMPLTLRVGFALQRPNEFLVYEFRYSSGATEVTSVPVLDADRYVG